MKYNFITPEGTRDLLFEECTVRREIESKLMDLFRDNGYSEVITPFVEFYDVFDSVNCHIPVENMYKLTDPKGRIMVIRPDSTLPIIRLAETRLKNEPRPLKLCYNQTIYRANPKEAGRDDEIAQCGVEQIYDKGIPHDDSVLALAKLALEIVSSFTGSESCFEIVNEDRSYYKGTHFNGYIADYGKPVVSGGNYEVNGIRAQGFAVNVTAIAKCKNKPAVRDLPLRIALTKGRVEKESVKLFGKMGWDMSEFANRGRKLIFTVPNENVEIVVAKSPDVITFVENGDCDIGITGKDMILEYGGRFVEALDLGIGKCRFSLAAKSGSDFYAGHEVKTVASKYTNVTRRFFEEEKNMCVDIIKIEGSVELTPLLQAADGIVDIVETGATLKENGLEVIEDIADISARVIVNPVKMKMKKKQIDTILKAMEGSI
jgi:ATP phosphoribosyltransferase